MYYGIFAILCAMKNKVINFFRWIAAALLPIPVAASIGLAYVLIAVSISPSPNDSLWRQLGDSVFKCAIETVVMPYVVWFCAPENKYRAAVKIISVYVVLFVLFVFYVGFVADILAYLDLLGVVIGLVAGFSFVKQLDKKQFDIKVK